MKTCRRFLKQNTWLWILLSAFALTVFAGFPLANTSASSALQSKPRLLGNFDIRVNGNPARARSLRGKSAAQSRMRARISSMAKAADALRVQSSQVRFSPLNGSVEIVSSKTGALTPPAPGREGIDIVRDYLRANAAVYGLEESEVDQLHFIGESVSPDSGLRMVRFEQIVNDIPVFQSETRAILDRDGRLIRTLGLLASNADEAEPLDDLISPERALVSALDTVDISLNVSAMRSSKSERKGNKASIKINDPQIADDASSRLVYFPMAPGVLIPAWSQVTFTNGNYDWYTLVDARTGELLWRKNIRSDVSTQEARFSVYVQADGKTPADSPAPQSPSNILPGSGTQFPEIARTIVNMLTVQDITASPNGWIDDGGTTTTGNNVDAYVDRVAPNGPDTGTIDIDGRPIGNPDANTLNRDFLGTTPRDFTYNPAPQGGNPEAGDTPTGTGTTQINFRRGAVTQLFYVTNWYHDQLFNLGFDEAAGNFQLTNFSGMGLGNDRVLAECQDSSGTNNANFATPPDGTSGRMQMFRFTFPTIDRDGSLDTEIVIHELTHGLSNRLIGNADGLIWSPGQGMGEGWSDFYALSLLNNTNADDPDGMYATGAYATFKLGGLLDNYLYGIRRFPYSTDNSVNPLTWADADSFTNDLSGGIAPDPLGFNTNGALEVHNVGEIWCLTLWEMRSRIIADPGGANGDVPTGNLTSLQIVTDAMKMTPSNPSFTDARDALIAADGATNSFANEQSIWEAFADRGLGYKAVAPLGITGFSNLGDIGIGESFSLPFLDAATVTVDDSMSNNNGGIDPGEPVKLTVNLFNPWNHTSKGVASATATLTSSTPEVTIMNGNGTYGPIAPQATVGGTQFTILVSPSAVCGQSLKFSLQTTSSLGTTTTTFTLRVGTPSGTGAPITFTRTIPGGLPIPDADPLGAKDTFTITNDLQIADIDFRIDSLTHTFTGDLTVMLKAPNGYGTDLIWLREILFGGGDGDNFINTVIDDESVNDLNQSFASDAPFTGDWLPAFNSPVWFLIGDPAIFPDPVGQLSRLDGQSTQGDWKLFVADQANIDTGTVNSWSLIVTPVAFTCQPFVCQAAAITQNPTVQGGCAGGMVTFTAAASGSPTPTVQWQVSTDGGATFTDVPGATSTSLTVMVNPGRRYRAVFTSLCGGTATTTAAALNVMDSVIKDDSSGSTLMFNSLTGDYIFCCGSSTFIGKGTVSKKGNVFTLTDNSGGRRVQATLDQATKRGNASLQSPVGTTICSISDRNTANSPCSCGP